MCLCKNVKCYPCREPALQVLLADSLKVAFWSYLYVSPAWNALQTHCAALRMIFLLLYFPPIIGMDFFPPTLVKIAPWIWHFCSLSALSLIVPWGLECLIWLGRTNRANISQILSLLSSFPPGSELLWGTQVLFCSPRGLEVVSILRSNAGWLISSSEV